MSTQGPAASAHPAVPNLNAPPPGGYANTMTGHLPERAVLLVAPVTTFYLLAIICVGLRIWAKKLKKNSLRFNDYAIFIATLFATAYLSICWLVVERGGIGYPLIKVRPSERKLTQQSFVVAWLLQAWGNTFVRLSILDFFAHVFRVSRFTKVVYLFEGLAVAYLIGCTITWFSICRPLKYNWELGPAALQHCGNLNMKFLLSSIFNLTLDVCILILPMPMLWTLQLNARKKAALTVVFGLGVFVCFATAWRTYNVVAFSSPAAKMNFTITIVEDALWSGLEITLGITNACMPVMQPALQKIFNVPFVKLLSLTTRRSTKPSKMSDSDRSGNSSAYRGPSWRRLDDSNKSTGSSESKHGITQEYTIDIEAQSTDGIVMDNMGQTAWVSEPKRP